MNSFLFIFKVNEFGIFFIKFLKFISKTVYKKLRTTSGKAL